jgi:hypothetical protein
MKRYVLLNKSFTDMFQILLMQYKIQDYVLPAPMRHGTEFRFV